MFLFSCAYTYTVGFSTSETWWYL